jgi:2-methylcitrate dehydratase PrpD
MRTRTETFTARLCTAVREARAGDAATRRLLGRAIADTIAVAAPGFTEPVTRSSLAAFAGDAVRTWSGETCESRDAATFINATAGHALDFDDVFLDSTTHPSTVILPAILHLDEAIEPDELLAAYAAGLLAARAVGSLVGFGHYLKGWHATGTIGTLAAAAAAGRLYRLDEPQLRAAFALAAAQAGGMKRNFGTMAKPAHAGFAAAAGRRAARLAAAGVDGAHDIFAPGIGFADLYGTGDGVADPGDDAFAVRPDRISLKLYPCCYAAHRLIGIGLDARAALGERVFEHGSRAVLSVPAGSVELIRNDDPKTGLEAKFSAKYALAIALADGDASLARFTDRALQRPGLAELLERVTILDDPEQQSGGDIEMGEVRLEVVASNGERLGHFARRAIPGGPDAPPARNEVARKVEDCLRAFESERGRPFPIAAAIARHPDVAAWLDANG